MNPSHSTPAAPVSLYDARPFFEKALQFGVQNRIIDSEKLNAIRTDAPKGMVQIARYFGNENLRPDLEKARERIVNLVSLCLQGTSGGDLRQAAESLCEHSFLSRSKCGSDMLKAMLAMPDSTSFHASLEDTADAGRPPQGLAEWSLKGFADYQAEVARRRPIQLEKDAAVWMAGRLGTDLEALEEAHTHAEAVIRTALLAEATGLGEMPDWVEFDAVVGRLRKQHRSARAPSETPARKASGVRPLALSVPLPQELPGPFHDVVQALRQSVLADLPQMLDSPLAVRALFANDSEHHHAPLLGRYFWVEDIASEMHHHEQSVSGAWDKVTGGHCDDGSLLTLLLCVAAGAVPKTVLSARAAAALVRTLQKPAPEPVFKPERARQYILDLAPAEYQEAYLALWDEFVDEAAATLQSDSTFARKDALALLRRECHVAGA